MELEPPARYRMGVDIGGTFTDALVTGEVARVALLTTAGHGDAVRIMGGGGRILGTSLEVLLDYQLSGRADPVAPRERVFELDERIDRDGRIVVAIDDVAVDRTIDRMLAAGIESVAITYLWSFANPIHERRTLDRIRARCPETNGSSSSPSPSRSGAIACACRTLGRIRPSARSTSRRASSGRRW